MHQMMKTRYFFALSLLALVFSCGKEVQDQMPGPDDLVTILDLEFRGQDHRHR